MADMAMLVDTAVKVPVNLLPLIDDADFKAIEDAIAYNAGGMDIRWNFVTPAGVMTSTAVTPTTGGDYDWTHKGDGIYEIEIPASGGASINNDTEGFGWFSGKATGVLPFRGPVILFAPANVINSLILGTDKLDINVNEWKGSAAPDNTGDAYARLGAPEGESIAADLAVVVGYVDCLPATWVVPAATGDAMTLTADYDAAKTAAQAGNAMALTSGERTTLAAAIEAAMINELDGTAVMQALADLIANDMTGGDLSVQAIAAATRDVLLDRVLAGNHDLAGTVGKLLQFLDVAVSSRLATSGYTAPDNATIGSISSAVTQHRLNAEVTLDKLGTMIQLDEASSPQFTANAIEQTPAAPTAAVIADAVLDELIAEHAGAGSVGQAISAAGGAADPLLNAVPGAYAEGTAGHVIGTNLDAKVSEAGGGSVTILPLQSTAGNTGRLSPIYLTAYQHCQIEATILVVDHEGNAVDLTGKTLSLVAWDADAPTVAVFELRSDGASPELTIGGASSNQVTIDGSDTHTATARELQWRLYNVTDDRALASGKLTIVEGAVGPVPT